MRTLRVVAAMLLISLLVVACSSPRPKVVASAATPASAARAFLTGYVDGAGRVIRHDQGGDTVSEGQAYAMLLDLVIGDRAQFAQVWKWTDAHLMQSDGLLAFHWASGRVLDANSASDADLDVARALVLAGERWSDATWTRQGQAYATAILRGETVEAGGQLWLVAGPWARVAPFYVDPSYFDPATFELLARSTGDPRWSAVEASSARVIEADTDHSTRLPTDWAQVSASGSPAASSPPQGGQPTYGYDAFRTLVRQDDECREPMVRSADSKFLTLAARTASPSDPADTYTPLGTPEEAGHNPLMSIAAAGAAEAGGQRALADRYLDAAAQAEQSQGSYYLDAWVAVGRAFLTTSLLSDCGPSQ